MINVYQDTTKTDDKVSGSNNYTGHILKKTEEETDLSTSAEKYVQKLLYKILFSSCYYHLCDSKDTIILCCKE